MLDLHRVYDTNLVPSRFGPQLHMFDLGYFTIVISPLVQIID